LPGCCSAEFPEEAGTCKKEKGRKRKEKKEKKKAGTIILLRYKGRKKRKRRGGKEEDSRQQTLPSLFTLQIMRWKRGGGKGERGRIRDRTRLPPLMTGLASSERGGKKGGGKEKKKGEMTSTHGVRARPAVTKPSRRKEKKEKGRGGKRKTSLSQVRDPSLIPPMLRL